MRFTLFSYFLFRILAAAAQNDYYFYGANDTIPPIGNITILDTVISKNRVFISGENHEETKVNIEIELSLMKYLNEKGNVRNMILELGYSRGYMLDKYINGDSSYFNLLIATTSYRYLRFYRNLRTYNQSLPPDRRIRVHGIDVERFPDDAPVLLDKLLPAGKPVPEQIAFTVESIRSYARYYFLGINHRIGTELPDDEDGVHNNYYWYYYKQFKDGKVIDTLLEEYKRNRNDFMTFLGGDSAVFDKIIQSMKDFRLYTSYKSMPQEYIFRERLMFANLKELLDQNPEEKYFGQFGRCHISLKEIDYECEWWAFSSLVKRLNESEYKDQVLNIALFYKDNFDDLRGWNKEDRSYDELYKYLYDATPGDYNLYKVNSQDSLLFTRYRYLITCHSGFSQKRKKNYFSNSLSFNLSSAFQFHNLKNLNKALFRDYEGFASTIQSYSMSFSNSAEDVFFMDFGFTFIPAQHNRDSSFGYALNGYSIYERYGATLTVGKRWAFIPAAYFGFSRMKLSISNDSSRSVFSPGFSEFKKVSYKNPGFLAGPTLEIRYAISPYFALSLQGSYIFDISEPYWKRSNGFIGIKDKKSPETGIGYYGLSAGLCFLIPEY